MRFMLKLQTFFEIQHLVSRILFYNKTLRYVLDYGALNFNLKLLHLLLRIGIVCIYGLHSVVESVDYLVIFVR